MRQVLLVSCSAAVMLALPTAGAQQVESFRQLPLSINRDDRVRVVDQSGAEVTGRVIGFGRDGLMVRTKADDRRFTSEAVRRLDVGATSKARWTLIGAGAFALVGAAACGEAACAVFLGSLLGAPLGALVSPSVPSMQVVYRAPSGQAAPRPADRGDGGRDSLLEDLGMHVNLGDRVRLESVSGGTIDGFVTGLDDETFTICSDRSCGAMSGAIASTQGAVETRFTRANIRRVSTHRGHALVSMIIGFAALSAPCMSGPKNEWDEAFGMCGGFGAGLGALIGAIIRTSTVVYPTTESRVSFAPAINRDRVGMRVSYTF